MAPHTSMSVWSPQSMNTSGLRELESPVCQKLSAYDFQWDDDQHFTNFTCGSVCARGKLEKDCVGANDILQGDNQKLFVPTAMERSYIGDDGNVETARHLIPLEQHLQINLECRVSVQRSLASVVNHVGTLETPFKAHSGSSSYTLLVDSNDKVLETMSPNVRGVSMKLVDILRLAGNPNGLDSPQLPLGRNQLEKPGVLPGPAGRVSGLSVKIEMSCYSSGQVPSKFRVKGWDALCASCAPLPSLLAGFGGHPPSLHKV